MNKGKWAWPVTGDQLKQAQPGGHKWMSKNKYEQSQNEPKQVQMKAKWAWLGSGDQLTEHNQVGMNEWEQAQTKVKWAQMSMDEHK